MEVATRFPRWLLALVAGCIVTYCVVVLAVVATAPDLRLRFLLSDAISADSVQPQPGILIQQTPDAEFKGTAPKPGDRLVSLDQQEVANFLEYHHHCTVLFAALLKDYRIEKIRPQHVIL